MTQRLEFVLLAAQAGVNFRRLCRRFGISPKTGYKWKQRYREGGNAALRDRSRKPKSSPRRCGMDVAAKVVELRREQPTWGGRKLRRRCRLVVEKRRANNNEAFYCITTLVESG